MNWVCPVPFQLISTNDTNSYKNMADGYTGLPLHPHPGSFGFQRKFHKHEGVDLYAPEGTEVFAVEDGIVVNILHFTGIHSNPPSSWWNDTFAVMVEGSSGVVLYGEIKSIQVNVGDNIVAGQFIGKITTVLKRDKGRPMSMLHLELYKMGSRDAVEWPIDSKCPKSLCDPTTHLMKLVGDNMSFDSIDSINRITSRSKIYSFEKPGNLISIEREINHCNIKKCDYSHEGGKYNYKRIINGLTQHLTIRKILHEGVKKFIIFSYLWLDCEGNEHNPNGPSRFDLNPNRNPRSSDWSIIYNFKINNKYHRLDGPAYIEYYSNGIIKKEVWYNNGKMHRIDGTALITRTEKNVITEYEYQVDGEIHRDDGPAWAIFNDDGSKRGERWYINNKPHRENGPAWINYDIHGNIIKEDWYGNGKYFDSKIMEIIKFLNLPLDMSKWDKMDSMTFKILCSFTGER